MLWFLKVLVTIALATRVVHGPAAGRAVVRMGILIPVYLAFPWIRPTKRRRQSLG